MQLETSIHTLLELPLSASNKIDCGAEDEAQCPLVHQNFILDPQGNTN